MSINFQTVHDALVALITVVGIAVVLSGALVAASAIGQRGKKRGAHQGQLATVPVQHPTASDDRELVLR
jgi:uncharacterized membrane protein HdeD (DUF308 family)